MKTFTFLLILILYLSKSECREIESDHYIIEDHNDDKHLLEVEGSGTKLQPDSKVSDHYSTILLRFRDEYFYFNSIYIDIIE